MDPSTYDRILGLFAAWAARRGALVSAAGAAVAALPDAVTTPAASKRKGRKHGKTGFLFVQTATGGSLSDNGDGTFDLVLEGHRGGTIYFSDRPQRIFGIAATEDFIQEFDFSMDNPPNAALLVNPGDTEDVAIVELFDPTYDGATGRLAYTVRILGDYDESGLEHLANQVQDGELPAAFGEASLFIDASIDPITPWVG